jgi:hypothetical protein
VGTRIRGTWRSSKLSEEIWGMPDWELVYALVLRRKMLALPCVMPGRWFEMRWATR